ncbi:MAG TPA: calcium-binding protein [Solirubrobacterales bacterium]
MASRSSRQGTMATVAVLGLLLVAAASLYAAAGWRPAAVPRVQASTVGSMALIDSNQEGAIFDLDNVAPGQTGSGEVTIANDGEGPGALSLLSTGLSNAPGRYGGLLSQRLMLRIEDLRPGAAKVVYDGGLASMPQLQLGTLAAGESRTYRFQVTMLDGGAPATPFIDDNVYQRASTDIGYEWTLTEVEGGDPGAEPKQPTPTPPSGDPSPPVVPPTSTPQGTPGADTLIGSSEDDLIFGRGGADRIFGKQGRDRLFGGPGNDRIFGGPGADRLHGGAGRDRLNGGPGPDLILARGGGADIVVCGAGADVARVDPSDRVRGCERILGR